MKAIIWTKYGPPEVLQLQDVAKPTPKPNELLIRVVAATVTAGDCEIRTISFPLILAIPMRIYVGLRKPTRVKILGQEFAGIVEGVGSAATQFKVGDEIFGGTGFDFGAYAEYMCVPEDAVIAHKPSNMTLDEAATLPTGSLESLHFLGVAKLQPGERILINGAGGSIGTYGIQLAKHYGAEVIAVDRTDKLDMLRELGADEVIDYTEEDFTRNGQTYDVIFDIVGKSPFQRSLQVLNPNGRYLIANPTMTRFFRNVLTIKGGSKKVIFQPTNQTATDLQTVKELVEAGILKSVIDRRYPLEQTAEAHRYVEAGHKKGNVVISVAQARGGG